MPWRELERFRDERIPKLDHLRRAMEQGLRVPPTVWILAGEVPSEGDLTLPEFGGDWMVRSASPAEDTDSGSAAGRFHSERVPAGAGAEAAAAALRRVVASLERDDQGRPQGVVFAQPFVDADRAGVALFDGFHYEVAESVGDNFALTSGRARGAVRLGQVERGESFGAWLERIARAFPDLDRLDLEWALDERGYVLLQVRRALFEVRRDPLVSLANHREILGPAPSPWIVAALDEAGRSSFEVFAAADPGIGAWGERYARVAAGRAWMDFSAFFRVMDRWGLPRTFVTQGVGGAATGPRDGDVIWPRFLRSVPRLVRLQVANLRRVSGMFRELRTLRHRISEADGLQQLFDASVAGLVTALGVNFALGGALAGVQRVRRALGLRAGARVVTGEMGRAYEALRRVPTAERDAALDEWLARFGHRGPLESDPMHPRFAELREALAADLSASEPKEAERRVRAGRGPLFWLERRRELFRDELMKVWSELRRKLLAAGAREVEAGRLTRVDDVFFLTPEALRAPSLDEAAAAARAEWLRTRDLVLPDTARLSEVHRHLEAAETLEAAARTNGRHRETWSGVGLGGDAVEGRVVRADDLASFLAGPAAELGRGDVLVVPALEPAWGVLFGRVGAVVAELGGELSHASILLRELGTPAVVNCLGTWRALRDGEVVRVDPRRGRVQRVRSVEVPRP